MIPALEETIEVHTAGSPVRPGERWTNRSLRELVDDLAEYGIFLCPSTIDRLLREDLELGRRQAVKDVPLGASPYRNEQFERIGVLKAHYLAQGWPVVSVDAKKKELLGNFFRPGKARTDGTVHTLDHDFPGVGSGRVIPYGVYDLAQKEGFVLLATGCENAELAGDALRRWWHRLGRQHYSTAEGLLVLADCGGSNGYRRPLYRQQLCNLALDLGIPIRVAHIPPYCSKYNPIDHRLFCHLSRSLSGLICRSIDVIRDAFARTTTSTGLRVVVETARRVYQSGLKATAEFLQTEPTIRDPYLPQFNYTAPAHRTSGSYF